MPELRQHTISYHKADLAIVITRDWRYGLTDVEFRRFASPPLSFGLPQALEALGLSARWPAHGWPAWDRATVIKYISEPAFLLAQAVPLLEGNAALWEEAHDKARAVAQEEYQALLARQIRKAASDAWGARDWEGVVKAYGELHDMDVPSLASEEKRAQIAQREVGAEGRP